MSGAAFHIGSSKQDYQTQRDFLDAVEKRFGPLVLDLAAHEGNHVCDEWYGPGSALATDSLDPGLIWHRNGLLWLNPPFANIAPWAAKCTYQAKHHAAHIAFLVPASVGADWFIRNVWDPGYARVYPLNPRLSFDGSNPYPKDCMLCVFNEGQARVFEPWRWR